MKFKISQILSLIVLTVFTAQSLLGAAPRAFADEVTFFHSDQINSSNVITDSSGNRAALYEYDPYGKVVTHTGINIKHQFTGQEADDSTGLYYYNARYMDPQLGRFVSADDTISNPFDPQDLNRYSYVRNNPINFVDPSGHNWFSKLIGAIAGAVAFVASGFNPAVGIAAFSAVDSTISARQNGASWGRALSIGAIGIAGGIVGGAAGSTIGSAFGYGAGSFVGNVSSGIFAGAFAGGLTSAVAGGSPIQGGLAGAAGGGIGGSFGASFAGGLAGSFAGGGVASLVNGGSFINGAVDGIYNSIGMTVVSLIGLKGSPIESLVNQGKVSKGDRIFLSPELDPRSILVTLIDPGPTSHVVTYLGGDDFVDSAINKGGVGKRTLAEFKGRRGWVVSSRNADRAAILAAANSIGVKEHISYNLPPLGHVCSTCSNQIRSNAGVSKTLGVGPNTQLFNERKNTR